MMPDDFAIRVAGYWRRAPESLNASASANISTFEAARIAILIAVTDGTGPVALTGATVEAVFGRGSTVITGAPVIADAAAGGIGVPCPALSAGVWRMQVRVTIAGETQTVYDGSVVVRTSL